MNDNYYDYDDYYVDSAYLEAIFPLLLDDKRQKSVVNEDAFADINDLDDGLVIDPDNGRIAHLFVLVVNRHGNRVTCN